jgi:RNA polymerase sporulation-specific sigma factor
MGLELNSIVLQAKKGDNKAMETIIEKFTPFILKQCKNIYIKGYEFEDLIQIGEISLINAVKLFEVEKKKDFAGYAICSIKNNYKSEIRQKCKFNYEISLNSSDNIYNMIELFPSEEVIEEDYIRKMDAMQLYTSLRKLAKEDQELIEWVYLKQKSIKSFAKIKNLRYETCVRRKKAILMNLRNMLKNQVEISL